MWSDSSGIDHFAGAGAPRTTGLCELSSTWPFASFTTSAGVAVAKLTGTVAGGGMDWQAVSAKALTRISLLMAQEPAAARRLPKPRRGQAGSA